MSRCRTPPTYIDNGLIIFVHSTYEIYECYDILEISEILLFGNEQYVTLPHSKYKINRDQATKYILKQNFNTFELVSLPIPKYVKVGEYFNNVYFDLKIIDRFLLFDGESGNLSLPYREMSNTHMPIKHEEDIKEANEILQELKNNRIEDEYDEYSTDVSERLINKIKNYAVNIDKQTLPLDRTLIIFVLPKSYDYQSYGRKIMCYTVEELLRMTVTNQHIKEGIKYITLYLPLTSYIVEYKEFSRLIFSERYNTFSCMLSDLKSHKIVLQPIERKDLIGLDTYSTWMEPKSRLERDADIVNYETRERAEQQIASTREIEKMRNEVVSRFDEIVNNLLDAEQEEYYRFSGRSNDSTPISHPTKKQLRSVGGNSPESLGKRGHENTSSYKTRIQPVLNRIGAIPARTATVQPTTVQPTTVQPTTVQPTTVQPTTVQPTTVQPTTVQPTTVQPTTATPQYYFMAKCDFNFSDARIKDIKNYFKKNESVTAFNLISDYLGQLRSLRDAINKKERYDTINNLWKCIQLVRNKLPKNIVDYLRSNNLFCE